MGTKTPGVTTSKTIKSPLRSATAATRSTPQVLRRLAPGVSLRRLHKLTGINLQHLSRIFSGQRGLTIAKARIIARFLDVSLEQVCDALRPAV